MKLDEATPFTALIPQTPHEPAVIYNDHAALRMAVVERDAISLLDSQWDVPGVYLLLYPVREDGTFDLYVGKASTGGLRSRVMGHKQAKPGWSRALFVVRDTTHGFHSAHVGWLEGRLCSVARAAARTQVVNGNQPGDDTLPAFERTALELTIAPIRQVMRLLGYPLDPEDDTQTPPKVAITRRYHGVTLADLIAANLLAAGQTLEFTWTGHEGTVAEVLPGGNLLVDGKTYSSPSAAGSAVRGGAVNGWDYWAIRDGSKNLVSLGELRALLPTSAKPPK